MQMTEPANVVCAWCGAALGSKSVPPSGTDLHGICYPCVQALLAHVKPRVRGTPPPVRP